MTNKMEWSVKVPIFKNVIILRQLGVAIGIPFGILILVIIAITKEIRDTLYALGLILALFILTFLFIQIVYRGNYELSYLINADGIYSYTQGKQNKKNNIINLLTVIMGFLSRQPTVAGAGVLAGSRQKVMIRWKNIKKVKYDPKSHTILVFAGLGETIGVFCTKENYRAVENLIKNQSKL